MPTFIDQGWVAAVNAELPAGPAGTGHSHGSMYWSTAVETVISGADTPTKALGTTTVGANLQDFSMPANNRLTYLGRQTTHFLVTAALSMTAAGNNKQIGLYVAKNGTAIADSEIKRFVGTGSDIGAAAVVTLVELAQDEYVELFVANELDTVNLTIELCNFAISEVG